MALNGVTLAGSMCARSFVRHNMYDYALRTIAGPRILGYIFTLQIFIKIVRVPDLHLQGEIFELNTIGRSYVIIAQTGTNTANIAIAKK